MQSIMNAVRQLFPSLTLKKASTIALAIQPIIVTLLFDAVTRRAKVKRTSAARTFAKPLLTFLVFNTIIRRAQAKHILAARASAHPSPATPRSIQASSTKVETTSATLANAAVSEPAEELVDSKCGETVDFTVTFSDIQENYAHKGRHYHMARALGLANVEEYWNHLSGGKDRSSVPEDIPRMILSTTPILNSAGKIIQISMKLEIPCTEYPGNFEVEEYLIKKPKNPRSAREWAQQTVYLVDTNGKTVALEWDEIFEDPTEMIALIRKEGGFEKDVELFFD